MTRPSDERYARALRKKLRAATATTMELTAAGPKTSTGTSTDARGDDVAQRLARAKRVVEDTLIKLRDAGFEDVDAETRRAREDATEVMRQNAERRRAGERRRVEDEKRSIEAKRRRLEKVGVKSEALWSMHSMAKREDGEMDVGSIVERATTCARDAARVDAKSTSAGMWATAKLASRLEKTSSWCEGSERALGACATALCRRTVDIGEGGADARAASTTIWAAATISKTRCGPFVDDACARRAVNGAADVLKARAADANAQDAANAMWGAAKLRKKLDDECVRALARTLTNSTETRAEEMSIALWALATFAGDGWKEAATHAEPLITRAKEMAKKQPKQWSAQAVANAAWAAGKLATTGDVSDAKQLVTHLFAVAKTLKFSSQGFANVMYAAGAVRVDARLLPDVAKFAATGLKTRASTLSGADLAAVVETTQTLRLHTSLSDGDRLKREIVDALDRGSSAFDWQTVGRLDVVVGDVFEDDSDALSTIRETLRARGAETCAEIDARRDHFERGSADAMLARLPNAPLVADAARAFVVDDSTGSVKKKLRRVGWSVVSWHRFSCGDVVKGTPWPESSAENDGFFGAAFVRLPPTKASFAMIASVVAARVAFGGDVWIYGAVTEGLRSVVSELPKELFERAKLTMHDDEHGVVHCVRTTAQPDKKGKELKKWREKKCLDLREATGAESSDDASSSWISYPGLFAGGGLDVMTALLLRRVLPTIEKKSKLRVLDYCSGNGVIAEAVRRRAKKSKLHLLDADALALEAAKKNLTGDTVERVLSDGWTSLDATKRFDLILSNPPVHLGLAVDFAPLRNFLHGLPERLTDDGVAYFVTQRYVPTRALAADVHGLRVERDVLDARFVVWRCLRGAP